MPKHLSFLPLSVLSITLFAAVAPHAAAATPAPHSLVVSERFVNPLGFYDARPTFSWRLPEGSRSQTAYQVVVDDLWDSGRVDSDQSVWVPYEGPPLQSRQRVTWKARFWDQDGRLSDWSEPAHIEMGLLHTSDWAGKWIRLEPTPPAAETPAVAGKDLPVIVVIRALYGVPGDEGRQLDVTGKVRERIKRGTMVVEASNDLGPGDPALGSVKTLVLEYTIDGNPESRSVPENQALDLASGKIVDPPGAGRGKAGGKAGGKARYVPQVFRREFAARGDIERARLYVTAKGLYEVYLNGKRVGEDCLAPGWTPYHKRIETLTYDVTDGVTRGANALGAVLGEGWYAGPMMRKRFVYPEAKPALLLQLEITYRDGTAETVVTDESWRGTDRGPIRYSSIYHGEIYDARMEMQGWCTTGFDGRHWAGVIEEAVDPELALVPKRHHPTRVTEELGAAAVTEPEPGRFVFDLGQNMVGWPRLTIPVEAGKPVTVRVAEMLKDDGTLYTANYRGARSTDVYTPARTGTISWRPTFTFHGNRYVELSGLPEGVKPGKHWVTGLVLHSAFPAKGRFSSSHDLLNQLQSNIRWGQRGNYLDIPTDCPQRNERLGWTGDAQVFCSTSLFNYDTHSFWMSWLQSVREEQTPQGLVHHVVPDTGCGAGSPGWGDVAVTSPWNVHVATGDRRVLEENYGMMKKWVAAYERDAKDFIVNRGGYGDWLQPYARGGKGDTPFELIATAYFGYCTALTRDAARVLGQAGDATRYDEQFDRIRTAFAARFFDGEGRLTAGKETQTGYLMALAYNLLEEGQREGAVRNLVRLIQEEAGGHLRTGFLGTPLIAFVLDREGHTDLAYEVLFKETYPSWFYSIHQGATTMWERWNSYSHDGGFGNAGMNSFNHYAYGAIGQWMYERIAGLAPDPARPGYKHFFIKPQPGGSLTHAEASLDTMYGRAGSGWRLADEGLTVTATVPPNTTATFVVPDTGARPPTVTASGRPVELTEQDGRLTCPLGPGVHRLQITAVP